MDEIQVRADAVRAVKADLGHVCKQHPVQPERLDVALKNHAVEYVDAALRMVGSVPCDPFEGIA